MQPFSYHGSTANTDGNIMEEVSISIREAASECILEIEKHLEEPQGFKANRDKILYQ